jgi:hypothetical protein
MESSERRPRRTSKTLAVGAVVALLVVSGALLAFYVSSLPKGAQGEGSYPPYTNLPADCIKPAGGFLVIANINGFNDSIQHGAPSVSWPVITVEQGTTVNITVCNTDVQAHGFQVTHYFDSNIEAVEPGQVVHVSFLADRAGNFTIYCSIFCSIHVFMQNAQLRVLSS